MADSAVLSSMRFGRFPQGHADSVLVFEFADQMSSVVDSLILVLRMLKIALRFASLTGLPE